MKIVQQNIKKLTYTNIKQRWSDWDETAVYSVENDENNLTDVSVVFYDNYYYRTIVNDNIGFNPVEYLNTKWVKWDISNRYAMIDMSSQSKSIIYDDNLIVEFDREDITTLGIGNFEAEQIKIEHIDVDGNVIDDATKVIQYSVNGDVIDYYTYIYSDYTTEVDRGIKVDIQPLGVTLRITFTKADGSQRTACGFLIGGKQINCGKSLYGVNFSFNSFAIKETDDFGTLTIVKRSVQDIVDFETIINSNELMTVKRNIKKIYNEIVLFVVDESSESKYENMLTLGVVQSVNVVLQDSVTTSMSWEVVETI